MRLIRPAMLAAALLCAAPAWAQSETELFQEGGSAMLAAQREVTQRKIELATTALQAKDYKAARKHAQSVTRADPKRIEPWLMLGAAQQGLQDWRGARTTYTTAVRLSPGHPEARAGLGVALARTNDPKATIHLAWLDAKLKDCAGCWQAGQLARFKGEVETAIVEAQAASAKGP